MVFKKKKEALSESLVADLKKGRPAGKKTNKKPHKAMLSFHGDRKQCSTFFYLVGKAGTPQAAGKQQTDEAPQHKANQKNPKQNKEEPT